MAYTKTTWANNKAPAISSSNLNNIENGIENIENRIEAVIGNSAYQHNNIYRGKDITSAWNGGTVSTNIANGTFEDIYIGDYFTKSATIGGTSYTLKYIIAGLDPYYGYANNAMVSTHHISCIVTGLPNAQMNSNNTTSGGYYGSAMYTTTLPAYITGISNSLGSSHILSHNILPSTSINTSGYNRFGTNNGCSNNWGWYENTISLLTESQVYGHIVWSSSGYDTGEAYQQLPLFRMKRPNDVVGSTWWWLRDVASSSYFAHVSGTGNANFNNASNPHGVVPLVLLK